VVTGCATNAEDSLLEREADERRALAQRSGESKLSPAQRLWLSAMRAAAERDEFFVASDRLNLSAASRLLGKNRSSAQRAFEELSLRFTKERRRLG
jgi:hypothetical protein